MTPRDQVRTDPIEFARAEVQRTREILERTKELIDQARALSTQRMDATDRLVEERFAALKLALNLQATEVSRRLEVLNGEAGRLATMQSTYVPREVHESETQQIQAQVDDLKTHKAQTEGKTFAYGPLIAVLGTIVAGWILYNFRKP